MKCLDYRVRINDGPNYYILFKDLFVHRIYHFQSARPDPLILDGGSNIGMSILYFKHVYPQAHIIGFEPDPTISPLLEKTSLEIGLPTCNFIAPRSRIARARSHYMGQQVRQLPHRLRERWDGTFTATLFRRALRPIKRVSPTTGRFPQAEHRRPEWDVIADSDRMLVRCAELVMSTIICPVYRGRCTKSSRCFIARASNISSTTSTPRPTQVRAHRFGCTPLLRNSSAICHPRFT